MQNVMAASRLSGWQDGVTIFDKVLKRKFQIAIQEEKFISRIHNYCDRWCERCAFTSLCQVFAREQKTRMKNAARTAVKRKVEEKFPNAREFSRQGFDEIETVM